MFLKKSRQLGYDVALLTPCSLALTLVDYRALRRPENFLKEKRLTNQESVENTVKEIQ